MRGALRSSSMFIGILPLLLAHATTPVAAPQDSRFRTQTTLIHVDVVATDSSGRPVTGLTAEDFVILDRGKPQRIAVFEEVSHSASPSGFTSLSPDVPLDVVANGGAHAGRLVVLLLDDLNIWQGRTERVRALARRIVGDLGGAASLAVLSTSGDLGTEITTNPAVLTEAIGKFDGRRRLPFRVVVPKCGGLRDPDFWNVDRIHKTLRDVGRMLEAQPSGRKVFVFLSDGVVVADGSGGGINGLFATKSEIPCLPRLSRPSRSTGRGLQLSERPRVETPYTQSALLGAMDAMRRSNVTLYAIDPSAMVDSSAGVLPEDRERVENERLAEVKFEGFHEARVENGEFAWNRLTVLARDYLTSIATAGGGFSVVDPGQFETGISRLLTDLDHYYLLGFTPEDPKGKGYRPLEVKVNRFGVNVRYRQSYQAGAAASSRSITTSPMPSLLQGVLPTADLSLRVHATPFPGRGALTRVPVDIEVALPRGAVQAPDGSVHDELLYRLVVVNLRTKKTQQDISRKARMSLQPTAAAAHAPAHVVVQIGTQIELAPGNYQVRLAAISSRAQKSGSVYLSLQVPDYSNGTLGISGLRLGYRGGSRIPAVFQAAAGDGLPVFQHSAATLDRAFASVDDVYVEVEVAARERTHTTVELTVVDDRGGIVSSSETRLPSAAPATLRLPLPLAHLIPGAYVVRLTAKDGQAEIRREIGIVVRNLGGESVIVKVDRES